VVVKDLARRFSTSYVTIRSDLESLHNHGLVQRTHGGALSLQVGVLLDPSLRKRKPSPRREQRIAEASAALSGTRVRCIGFGTTATAVARALRRFRSLTVITNAVNIAAELAGTPIEVVLTGGTLRKNSFSLVGPLAEDTLHRLSADIMFLAVDGFDVHTALRRQTSLNPR